MKLTTNEVQLFELQQAAGAAQAVASAASELLPYGIGYNLEQQNRIDGLITALALLLMLIEAQATALEPQLKQAA